MEKNKIVPYGERLRGFLKYILRIGKVQCKCMNDVILLDNSITHIRLKGVSLAVP